MAITQFVPEIWSPAILANLRNALVYGALCNRDYEGDIANAGDTVHITSFSDPAVRDYTKNTDISWDLLTDATRALVIDQADYFAFTVDDIDRRQALPGFVSKASQGAGYNLANEVDSYVSGLMVAAINNDPTYDLGARTWDISDNTAYGTLVDLRTRLNRNNAPSQGRWVVVPPEGYAALLQDNRFINAQASADGGVALRQGFVGRAAGFDVYESNTVPVPTAGTYEVIAGQGIAVTFADQITETEAIRLQDQFGDGLRGLHLYGAKVVYPAALAMASITVQA
jgi:hypothetical protein